jgi:hypothetical protein
MGRTTHAYQFKKGLSSQRALSTNEGRQHRERPRLKLAGVIVLGILLPTFSSSTALALKVKDHILIVNRARESLKNAVAPYDNASISLPNLPDVKVANAEAVKAVRLCPEHFRAGALGPDIFPDVVEGQIFTHVNKGRETVRTGPGDRCSLKCVQTRGQDCDDDDRRDCQLSNVPLEKRKVDHWRAIDYGMYQLKEALAYEKTPTSPDSCTLHFQAVAFAYGYISHLITDGFGHSYVNEWARGIFDFLHGDGLYYGATEEVQHMAVDDYMESHLTANPADLKVSWPTDFLAKLYTSKLKGTEVTAALADDAGSFGGPFPKNVVKIRDVLTTLKDHNQWAAAIPGSLGDVATIIAKIHTLVSAVATFGTGIGDPIQDIEDYFRRREAIMNILMQRWPDISGCIGQNLAQGSAMPPTVPLREDRCATIDFESDPEAKSLFANKLNEAAHFGAMEGPDFNYGSTTNNLRKVMEFVKVVATRAIQFTILNDIRSVRVVKDGILTVCNEKGLLNNDSCTNFCNTVNNGCQEILSDVAYASCAASGCLYSLTYKCDCDTHFTVLYCGLNADDVPCYLEAANPGCWTCFKKNNNWIIDQTCTATVNAAIPICNFCTANPLCKAVDEITQLKAEVDAFIVNQLQPYVDEALKELGKELLEMYAGKRVNDYIRLYHDFRVNLATAKPAWFVNLAFLREDMSSDPEYLNRILQSMLSIGGQLASNAGSVGEAVAETSARTLEVGKVVLRTYLSIASGEMEVRIWEGMLDVLYRLARERNFRVLEDLEGSAYDWLDQFSFKSSPETYETRFGKFFALMTELNALVSVRGATVTALHKDLKLAPEEPGKLSYIDLDNYYVYHNSIQLTKLGLLGGPAITALAGPPAAGATPKSRICDSTPNIVCDSIQSLDDPNNYGYPALSGDQPDWERSVAYWASRDREWHDGTVTQGACVLAPTDFILADSRAKADKLYSKIFKYPDTCMSPRGMGLDDPTQPWTSNGPATVSNDPTTKTQGDGSMKVSGCGYTAIKSPTFNTTDFGFVSSTMALDILIPSEQANQWWWGDVKLFVSIPAAGVNNAFLGWVGLTGLPTNQWTTVTFPVPDEVKTALLGDYPRVQFTMEIQQVSCRKPANLDNLRFLPPYTNRTVFHTSGSSGKTVTTNPLFSFETLADWTGTGTTMRLEQTRKTDRASSLAVTASSWVTVTSRKFATSETPGATNTLNVDVWVPARKAGDTSEAWMHAYLSCPSANIYNQYLGNKGLEQLFYDEFNSVTFPLTQEQKNALSTARSDCSISLAFNAVAGRGEFLFDKMGFVQ